MLILEFALLSAPLFATVLIGYLLGAWQRWQPKWTAWLSKLVMSFVLPVMLFHLMSDRRSLPDVDARLLIAFFGGCGIVFVLGRLIAARRFRLDGVGQSIFGMGAIFSNNVLLGLPLAKAALGIAAVPTIALVVIFNALTLWTLVTVSIEWARHGSMTPRGLTKMTIAVLTTPLIVGILAGTLFGLSGIELPEPIERGLTGISSIAGPGALLVLGLGLAHYNVRAAWRQSVVMSALKLIVLPLVVWLIAIALHLPPIESKTIVLLSSMSVGANVYLMAAQFDALQGTVASAIVLSTLLAALTTPILLAATTVFYAG